MGSGLDDPLSQGDVGGNALDIEGSMSQQSAGNFSAEKTEEDWYREIQFHYNASLQQGYSAAETEEWLQQGYPTLMAGFLTWNQVRLIESTAAHERVLPLRRECTLCG